MAIIQYADQGRTIDIPDEFLSEARTAIAGGKTDREALTDLYLKSRSIDAKNAGVELNDQFDRTSDLTKILGSAYQGGTGYEVISRTLKDPNFNFVGSNLDGTRSPTLPTTTTPNPIVQNNIPAGLSPTASGQTARAGTTDVQSSLIPKTALQPGTSGPEVKALQDYLVSRGLLTPAQVATGPGIYGPQTTAAVLELQKQLGIDYSSGPGFFGPRTIAALSTAPGVTPASTTPTGTSNLGSTAPSATQTQARTIPPSEQTPMQAFNKILNDVGIGTNNTSSLEDIVKQVSDLYGFKGVSEEMKKVDDAFAEDVQNVNDDPWITEGIRLKRVESLKSKYDLKKSQLVDRLQLEDNILGRAITLYNAAKQDEQEILKKALDFQLDQLKTGNANTQIIQLSDGRDVLVDKATGNIINTIGSGTPTSTTPTLSSTQLNLGSSRLGILPEAYKKLDPQVQIWGSTAPATTFFDTVAKMSAVNEADRVRYDDILASINSSAQPQAVKDEMIRYLDKAAANLSESGASFWDKLVKLF